jgi:glutamine synthetase
MGVNLLEPGETPHENAQFLLFLSAVIKAVDDYQDLLRISVANAGNDHRLGANEAPPSIVSMFLGDELSAILESIENDTSYDQKEKCQMEIGASVLPYFPKDTTDRNRTSPFAFTGNKFEFRMLGSSSSISDSNIVLNTIVAEVLSQFADRLENAGDFKSELSSMIKETIKKHKRILFNGNNYSEEWVEEAAKRGLLNLKSTVDALPYFISEKNIKLFTKHNIFSESEIHSRYEVMLEGYAKVIHIEALTMIDMVKREIIPSVMGYLKDLSETACSK